MQVKLHQQDKLQQDNINLNKNTNFEDDMEILEEEPQVSVKELNQKMFTSAYIVKHYSYEVY